MNLLDKLISAVSPTAGLKRYQARLASQMVKRQYDAAVEGGRRNGGWWRPKTKAEDEVAKAADKLAATAQDLARNTPLGHRIKMIWPSNIAGSGIRAEINIPGTGKRTATVRRKLNEDFIAWAESTECDFDGHYDLYGLQWLWSATIVESGGVLIRKHVSTDTPGANAMMTAALPLKLQTLEQSMLDGAVATPKVTGHRVRSGVEFDSLGAVYGYHIKSGFDDRESIFLRKGEECIHLYRKERPGQHLGVSWLSHSATTIQKYDTLVDAKLLQDQIAACTGILIEGAEQQIGVIGKGDAAEQVEELEPGMVQYVAPGSKVHTITPPSSQGSQAFVETVRADIATGADLAYTQVTGDYSKLNFASGRMSKIEFFQMLDYAQRLMLKPGLDTVFLWYKQLSLLKNGSSIQKATVTWTYPPRAVVQPKEELDVLIKKVRSGFESPSGASKSLGTNLETTVEQWRRDKATFGEMPFDIDPSLFSEAGNQLNADDAASANTDSATGSDTATDGDDQP